MILALIVWLVMTALPAIKVGGIIVSVAFAVSVFFTGFIAADSDDSSWLKAVWKQKWWVIPIFLLTLMTPNEKTSWYMVGAYATQTVVQSETAKQFAGDGVDVLHSLMKKAKEKIDNYDAEDTPKEKEAKPK